MRHLLALALIVAGLGAAGKADIQEAQRHGSQYCLRASTAKTAFMT